MASYTTRYALTKPTVGGDADVWGTGLNQTIDDADALLGAITTAGSSNAYTLTTGLSLAAYVTGQSFDILASFSNSSTVTINVDGLGAKAITKNGTTALASGDIVSGNIYRISYDGTRFQLVGSVATGVYQPLDALLTAIAGLTTADDRMLDFTGTDTVAVVTYAAVLSNIAALPLAGGTLTGPLVIDVGTDATALTITGGASGSVLARFERDVGSTGRVDVVSVGGATQIRFDNDSNGTAEFTAGTDGSTFKLSTSAFGTGDILTATTALLSMLVALQAPIAISSETSGTLTSASANKQVNATGDITFNDGVFAAGARGEIYAGASARSIIQDTGMTLRLDGSSTTGTRTLAARGRLSWYAISNSEIVVSGMGVT